MAAQKKTTKGGSSSRAGSGSRGGSRKAPPKKKPVRREVGGVACLLLALFVAVSYFQSGAWLIDRLSEWCRGLMGYGYYAAAPALLLGAWILLMHRGRPVAPHLVCALALPVLFGALAHIAASQQAVESSVGSLKTLWASGLTLESGGAVSGALAIGFEAVIGKVATLIVFVVTLVACLLGALRLTPAAIIDAVKRYERVPYEEPEEESVRAAPKPKTRAKQNIDIPLDGEERPAPKAPGAEPPKTSFFRKRADHIRTPAEALREQEEAETAALAAEAAKPVGEPKPVETLRPEPKIIIAAAPVVEAPRPLDAPVVKPAAPVGTPKAAAAPSTLEPAQMKKTAEKLAGADVAEAAEEVAREIEAGAVETPEYRYPPVTLLDKGQAGSAEAAGAELRNNSRRLAETLKSFGVDAQAGDVIRGPSVTRYEFTLDQGVKLSKITNLQDDIALALGASGVRIAPIPDKISVVGVEVPNKLVTPVYIRDVLESRAFTEHKSNVCFAVGKDINGQPIVGNIAKFPHVLIAGTTGSGKSVCTNSLIVSMLYKSTPEEARFIMVDPKMVELAPYNGIPHLLIPVVTDPKKAAGALQWAVYEMMKRYKLFSERNVKELSAYNALAENDPELKKLPTVVVVIDELADLMLVAAKEVEESICRVAQMGRAAGMHLVIATQRPSADVITGLMKANIPSRIAFAVASSLESRIILDTTGAEKLVGRGDMLYAPLGEGKPRRVQGCLISAEEIERVVAFVKENGEASYDKDVIDKIEQNVAEKERGGKGGAAASAPAEDESDGGDELLPAAIEVVLETGQASVSMLQRRLKLGYSRAARIVDEMEQRGVVGPFEGSKPRQLLITKEQWQEMKMKGQEAPGAAEAAAAAESEE